MTGVVMGLLGGGGTDTNITLQDSYAHDVSNGVAAFASFSLNTNRTAFTNPNGGSYTWCAAGADPANYEVFATPTDGTWPTGTVNTWLALSSTRTWSITQASVGDDTTTFTVQVRRAGGSTILGSASVTLDVGRTS